MANKPNVFDATEANFEQRVILRSRDVPVVVDFWAPWCGPCKTLGPLLEKIAAEHDGRFELVKVNVDECQQLAMMFRVQSVPTVYAFRDGQPVDGFAEAQPESVVRQWIDRFAPAPEREAIEVGEEALAAGDLPGAHRGFLAALQKDANHGRALLGMARVLLARGDADGAKGYLNRIDADDPVAAQAERVRGVLAFADDADDEIALRARIEADRKDVEAWYKLGATLAASGRTDEALEAMLRVVEIDRSFREDAGRKALLSLFDLLGHEEPRVISFRRRLSSVLF